MKADIARAIQRYMKLGEPTLLDGKVSFWVRCPFHRSKDDCMEINRDDEYFHCSECGARGGMVDFIMQYEKIDKAAAIKMLEAESGSWYHTDEEIDEIEKGGTV